MAKIYGRELHHIGRWNGKSVYEVEHSGSFYYHVNGGFKKMPESEQKAYKKDRKETIMRADRNGNY